ncbi:hypothetical protein [Sneathiella litorea]|uniref:Yip1 domain-containing protein n=1 Tax=Sneathiella litorea TaxID=2606216 RepID=A0A6L8W4C3_9PROT|nr:hypothetical protein [Sneathiella litorea]MZR29362.1 hypothetical protein [Sneathiella litorea]
MLNFREIVNSLYGAYLFARRDPNALSHFNISMEGFYRSFLAMILAIPLFAIENSIDYRKISTDTAIVPFLLLLCLALLVSWGTYLLIMAVLARYMGFSNHYSVFVIVYNWMQFAIILLWLPISIIATGVLPESFSSTMTLFFIAATYIFLWYVLKVTLNLSGMTATGFAFLEFLIVILIQGIFSEWLFTAPV